MTLIYDHPHNIVTVENLFLCRLYVVAKFLHFVSIYIPEALVCIIIFPLLKLVLFYIDELPWKVFAASYKSYLR